MAQNEWRDVLPEELAAVDELARLLEQYQTYLLAGSAFADSVRAQAVPASGTARPVLERLLPKGAEDVARIEAALRRPRTEEDRKTVLEEVEPALKDLRALLALAKRRTPAVTDGVPNSTHTQVAPTVTRSKVWISVGSALVVGLILGAFGTHLPRSSGSLARLWTILKPIIATGSGAILGGLLLQDGLKFKVTLRKHWAALLISSILLLFTAPTAVDAAKELLGIRHDTAAPALQEVKNPLPRLSSPAPTTKNPPPEPTENPSPQPGTDSRRGTANVPGRGTVRPPGTVAADCAELVERQSLGEELTHAERAFLKTRCRNGGL